MGAIASGFDNTKARIFSVVPTALNERKILIKNSNKKIVVKSLFLRKKNDKPIRYFYWYYQEELEH